MVDWLDLLPVCVNEWMRRKWLENGLGYNVYVHYMLTLSLEMHILVEIATSTTAIHSKTVA